MSRTVPYTKLVGTGNDFVLVDALRASPARGTDWAALARGLCDPRRGEGTDGLLVLGPSRRADVRMRIFNPDGSEPTMCGNGIRCLAWYAHASGAAGAVLTIETGDGIKRARIRGARRVRVDMGVPVFRRRLEGGFRQGGRRVDTDRIDSGVPHLVCWVPNVSRVPVDVLGRRLRRDPRLGRTGANVDFVQIVRARGGRAVLKMRTYERGVEGETQACGTGSVAAAPAFSRRALMGGVPRAAGAGRFRVAVRVPGGTLQVELTARRNAAGRVVFGPAFLEGEARPLSSGSSAANGRSAR
jgi:diaminopimelate epimerase